MSEIVFLIGHPASGKTSLYRLISLGLEVQGFTTRRVNDREYFNRVIREDAGQKLHRKSPDGTRMSTTPALFERLFSLLKQDLIETRWEEDWVFVETTSADYESTLKQLGLDFLQTCSLVLVLAPYAVAMQRNDRRAWISEDLDEGRVHDHYIRACFEQKFKLEGMMPLFRKAIALHNGSSDHLEMESLASEAVRWLLQG
ncbi:MAG TPA: hypothetical protein VF498_17225 [Anaerolineales bacterium]